MKRLVSTLNLSKEDWLRYRKCGITGTDAGAILGLNPYRSAFQVYHDKISDTIENIDNEAMRQGRDLEDYVAQRFTEATGLKVRRANAIYQSEGDTQQINQLYSADDRNKTADLNPIRDLLDKRQELSDQIEQMEQEKTAIEQQVKLQMQDAAYGTAPGYKVSWVSSESKRVDSQRLRKEQPDIFNRYSKNVSSRRFTIIHAA